MPSAGRSTRATTTPALLLPAGLEPGEPYYLWNHGDERLAHAVRSLLTWASAEAACVGSGTAVPRDTTTVLYQPDSLEQASRLVARGIVPQDRVRFLPLPTNYPWAFWNAWQAFSERPDLLSDPLSLAAFTHYVRRCPYLGGDAIAARLSHWNALRDGHLYWDEARETLEDHRHELDEVRAHLADEHSRRVFDLVLESSPRKLWAHYISTVFATEDTLEFDAPRPGEQILNLGVFSGHELPYLAALVGGRGTIHCIDPDGLDLLSDYTRALVTACPERIREARFTAGGYAPDRGAADGCSSSAHARSARATRHRASPISTVDSYVESSGIRSIGFIKIDIHGMEQAALDGLAHTLAAHRPTLSVSISTRPEHLWSLPLRLMATLRRYEFHISHRSPVRWKTLLTAVPIERAAKARRSSPQAR